MFPEINTDVRKRYEELNNIEKDGIDDHEEMLDSDIYDVQFSLGRTMQLIRRTARLCWYENKRSCHHVCWWGKCRDICFYHKVRKCV